jgi:hypothetical protein
MAGYLAAEHLNSDGEPEVPKKSRSTGMRRPRRRVAKKTRVAEVAVDAEDNEGGSHDYDFISILSDSSESSVSGSGDDELLTNAEVRESHFLLHIILVLMADTFFIQLADILPSKTVPKIGRGSQKRKRHSVTVEEVEDENSPRRLSAHSTSPLNNDTIIEEIPSSESATAGASKNLKKNKVRIYIIDL